MALGLRRHVTDHRRRNCEHVRAHASLIRHSDMARLPQLHHHHLDLLPHHTLPEPSVTNDVSSAVVIGLDRLIER